MRSLRQILSAEASLAGLLDRRQREVAILQRVKDSLPPALAAQVGVAAACPPELALVAATGAAAGLLRQRAPALVNTLQYAGWKFTGIKVRVQARPPAGGSNKNIAKQLDSASAGMLLAHAQELADPTLAAALRRLADHAPAPPSAAAQALEGIKQQDPE
jgi:hypothetical protein